MIASRGRLTAMRILLLNQFYPPDLAPTGRYLHDLARALVADGHDVTVIASRHAYGGGGEFPAHELLDGVRIERLPGSAFGRGTAAGKLADYALYYGGLAVTLAREQRPELVVALTTPPFVGLLAAWTARLRGARHAHWVMDLYPDVLRAHGTLGAGPAYRALQALTRHAFDGASAIITLGPAMAERCRTYAGSGTPVDSVALWAPDELSPWSPGQGEVPLRRERGWPSDRLVLLYSGNLGLGHRFDEMLTAAEQLGASDASRAPIWAFAGQGRARPRLERFVAEHPTLPVQLLDHVPSARLREHLCSADVHLTSLEPSWEGTLLPSKLQASLAVGKPVLHVGEPSGDLARVILDHGCGWVVPPDDGSSMLAALEHAQDPAERATRGQAAHEAARTLFDRDRNLAAMRALLA